MPLLTLSFGSCSCGCFCLLWVCICRSPALGLLDICIPRRVQQIRILSYLLFQLFGDRLIIFYDCLLLVDTCLVPSHHLLRLLNLLVLLLGDLYVRDSAILVLSSDPILSSECRTHDLVGLIIETVGSHLLLIELHIALASL